MIPNVPDIAVSHDSSGNSLPVAGVPCTENKHCGARAHCTVDTCYANTSGSPCTEGSDCGPASMCVSGKCN